MPVPTAWWHPENHRDRRPFLTARGRVTRAVRSYFNEREFEEVETAALQISPGNETHLHGIPATWSSTDGRSAPFYLHTSPEFACKKLLAAGEERIYTLARVYRDRERGPLHHPEFTMLEWYRVGEPYQRLMDDCATLLSLAAEAAGTRVFCFRGKEMDPFLAPQHIGVAEAFAHYAGIDLLATLDDQPDRESLARQARAAGIRIADDDTWSDIFSRVLVALIEPHLGIGRAVILDEYPACEAALARRKPGDPRLSERFELYACGVELVNAFGELTDPVEQRSRFVADMDEKERIYGLRYPLDEELLEALSRMPAASGAALGFDRLAMLASGASHIEQVMWAPVADPFA